MVQQIENKKNTAWNDSWADDTLNPNRLQTALKCQRTCKQAAFKNIIQKQNLHTHTCLSNPCCLIQETSKRHAFEEQQRVCVCQIIQGLAVSTSFECAQVLDMAVYFHLKAPKWKS